MDTVGAVRSVTAPGPNTNDTANDIDDTDDDNVDCDGQPAALLQINDGSIVLCSLAGDSTLDSQLDTRHRSTPMHVHSGVQHNWERNCWRNVSPSTAIHRPLFGVVCVGLFACPFQVVANNYPPD